MLPRTSVRGSPITSAAWIIHEHREYKGGAGPWPCIRAADDAKALAAEVSLENTLREAAASTSGAKARILAAPLMQA